MFRSENVNYVPPALFKWVSHHHLSCGFSMVLVCAHLGIQDLPGLHSFAEKSGGFGAGDQLISAAGWLPFSPRYVYI